MWCVCMYLPVSVCMCVRTCVFIHCLHKKWKGFQAPVCLSVYHFWVLRYLSSIFYHNSHTLDQACESMLHRHTWSHFFGSTSAWLRPSSGCCVGYDKGNHINQADLFLHPIGNGFVWCGELVCRFGSSIERPWTDEVQRTLYSTRSGAHGVLVMAFVLCPLPHASLPPVGTQILPTRWWHSPSIWLSSGSVTCW